MVLADHVHEGLQQPDCNLVSTLVVVAIAGEVALGLVADGESVLVALDLDRSILDGGDRVNHMAEAGDTRGEGAAHVGIDEESSSAS